MSTTFTLTKEYDFRSAQYDLDSLFRYAVEAPFEIPAEVTLYACVMGENDESNWYWIFETGGQVYYATGGCDYTGWDCQSSGDVVPVDSIDAALEMAPEKESSWSNNRVIRQHLQDMIDGKTQIGVI